ncbi:hypothetical protein ACF3NT_11275 [Naumannella halotolerans]|uniref:hypothetical protein n=1 Tax=Naumannella halotolerans TaxID=993414 RepID=UPI00370DAE33
MGTRWSASLEVGWHPILTFERRRTQFLDWAEENVDYTGFADRDSDFVGLQLGGGARIEVSRSSLRAHVRYPAANFDVLRDTIDGAMKIFSPQHPRLLLVKSQWSSGINAEYKRACRTLAQRSLAAPELNGAIPADTSILVDVLTSRAQIQVEYGVVERAELVDRLTKPAMSRVEGLGHGLRRALQQAEVDEVSLYYGVSWVASEDLAVVDWTGILSESASGLNECGHLVGAISSHLMHELEEQA